MDIKNKCLLRMQLIKFDDEAFLRLNVTLEYKLKIKKKTMTKFTDSLWPINECTKLPSEAFHTQILQSAEHMTHLR
jgi:hypothetical protein